MTVSRDELIEKKNRIEEEYRKLSNRLKAARRDFAATGKGLKRIDLANLESRESFLKSEMQRVAAELGANKGSKKSMSDVIHREFINVARVILDDDVFAKILKRAGDIAAIETRGKERGA